MLIQFEDIPHNFVSAILTRHQKEGVQMNYYIKSQLDKWEGLRRTELYGAISQELKLSPFSIRKMSERLPREIKSGNLICPCCHEPFELKPIYYWSYENPDGDLSFRNHIKTENILILCSPRCYGIKKDTVKKLYQRRFYESLLGR